MKKVFLGAFNFSKNECSDKSMQKVHDTLEKMAIENLKAWEPPFNEEKFLSFFTQGDDFSFAVDGFHVTNYQNWKQIVYQSMDYDRKNYKEYKDIVINTRTNVINKNYGFVTIDYVWDYTTNEDNRYKVNSVVTMLFKNEKNEWKIVNTHCSHGEKQIVN